MSTGAKLKRARVILGFTQEYVGEQIGYSDKSISLWERAPDPNPIPTDALLAYKELCKVPSISYFTDGKDTYPADYANDASGPLAGFDLDGYTLTITINIDRRR